jgi:hypothetical protein
MSKARQATVDFKQLDRFQNKVYDRRSKFTMALFVTQAIDVGLGAEVKQDLVQQPPPPPTRCLPVEATTKYHVVWIKTARFCQLGLKIRKKSSTSVFPGKRHAILCASVYRTKTMDSVELVGIKHRER